MLYGYIAVAIFVTALSLIVGLCLFAVRAHECGMISRQRMWQIVGAIIIGVGLPLLLALFFWTPAPKPENPASVVNPVNDWR